METNRTNLYLLYAVVLLLVPAVLFVAVRTYESQAVPWSQVKEEVATDQIESIIFDGAIADIQYKSADPALPKTAKAVRMADDPTFLALLDAHHVSYSARPPAACDGNMGMLLMLLVAVSLAIAMARRDAQSPPGVATFGKSQAKLAPEEGTGVSFDDVAGIDEAEEELSEIVQFLKTPEKFTALGGKIPKGVLLVGPPGTGKTLLARAVAGEAGVPFFSISGSDFVEMFVGVGAARVRDLFQQAARQAPCIIFIDELDAIGKARGGPSPVGGHDEREQTLNQLLVEMDGFDGRQGVIIMAATNRPETLDPALLRAGRFDRQVVVTHPDVRGRRKILEIHARGIKLAPTVDLDTIAQLTPGFTGSDLANVLNEAALLAARRNQGHVEVKDIQDAVERSVVGLEMKSRRISDKEKIVVAYHEAGHAICSAASKGSDPVHKISIIPTGIGALGYTLHMPPEDRVLTSRTELISRLTVLYGGRIAEDIVFGDITTGAANDIQKASELARRMVTQYGMTESLGAVDYGGTRESPFGFTMQERGKYSDDTARRIDAEVRRLLDDAQARANTILQTHRGLLERMAKALLEHEVLDRTEVDVFLREVNAEAQSPVQAVGA